MISVASTNIGLYDCILLHILQLVYEYEYVIIPKSDYTSVGCSSNFHINVYAVAVVVYMVV